LSHTGPETREKNPDHEKGVKNGRRFGEKGKGNERARQQPPAALQEKNKARRRRGRQKKKKSVSGADNEPTGATRRKKQARSGPSPTSQQKMAKDISVCTSGSCLRSRGTKGGRTEREKGSNMPSSCSTGYQKCGTKEIPQRMRQSASGHVKRETKEEGSQKSVIATV